MSPEELNKAPFPFLSFLSQSSGYFLDAFAVFTVYAAEESRAPALMVLSAGDAQMSIRHCAILPARAFPHGRLLQSLI
ncbi:hypothetical protein KCP71_13365 [Salmonella enterica subsp. enterica]|nr:hypothetical protein KCP71_13365 [Salmonella enterica subsp. enterica]